MSHFTKIKTQMVEKEYLLKALKDVGYSFQEGNVEISGWGGKRQRAQIKVPTKNPGYDIGFTKTEQAYEMVADWYGIRDIDKNVLTRQLTQRYSYHAARGTLESQGFEVVDEKTQQDGQVHMVLRRMR